MGERVEIRIDAPRQRYRCRFYGAMLLGHLSQSHSDQMGPYLARMAVGEEIATVAAEAYEVVEDQDEAS
jgi:hypothetical protein